MMGVSSVEKERKAAKFAMEKPQYGCTPSQVWGAVNHLPFVTILII